MFTATLYTTAKMWKEPKCLSMNEDVIYICNGTSFSHEKEGNHAICNIMDGPWGFTLNEGSQAKQDEHCDTACTRTLKTEDSGGYGGLGSGEILVRI